MAEELTQTDVDGFLAAPKVMFGEMVWDNRGGASAHFTVLGLERESLEVGSVVTVQKPGHSRDWEFTVKLGRTDVLRWDFKPPGHPRRHRNPRSRPAGFLSIDRAVIHEHSWDARWPGKLRLSAPLECLDEHDHRQAWETFCDRAIIDRTDVAYVPPPEPQLLLVP